VIHLVRLQFSFEFQFKLRFRFVERCRDTLLHEMCHAAVALIDGVMNEGHGPLWKQWTKKAQRTYPYLPPISVKHTYEINYKFIYRCVQCQYEFVFIEFIFSVLLIILLFLLKSSSTFEIFKC